ncbi:MAG: phosphatase PAP2 family protein [Nocardioidaceae bacterium]|nr:phosphatase PAP2 family protein [Nocardioidaceae bacterium]
MTDSQAERRAALIAAGIAAPLVILTVLVTTHVGWLAAFDLDVVQAATDSVRGTSWARFFHLVATATEPRWVALVSLALALWFVVRRQTMTATWIAATVITALAVRAAYQFLVHRPRPAMASESLTTWAFPSGHATTIATATGVLVVLTLQRVKPPRLRAALTVVWLTVAGLVGVDRVFVGAHYPSDVVAGWLLGALVVFVTSAIFGVVSTDRVASYERPLSSVPEDRKVLAVILNPIKIDADPFKVRVNVAVAAAGYDDPLWFETTVDDAGASMARAAVAAGADVVVAAGGDGTVRVVCSEMAGTGVPVGVIPAGTGNLLARNLGLPLPHDLALDTVLHGQDRAIDIVRIEGDDLAPTRFVVMAGLGLDAAIMAGAPDALKARIGWPAYVLAGAKQLRYPAVWVDISIDGTEAVRRRARTVVIGNVGSLQAGIPLLPDALIDDGVLDVVVIAPRRLFGWVSLILRVMTRHRRTDDRLDRFTGTSVTITAAHSTPRQLDGDIVGAGTQIRADIEAGRLLVRVPRSRPR